MKHCKKFFYSLLLAVVLASCTNYGKKTKSGPVEVYYKDGIEEKEAQATADFLAMIDKTQNGNTTEKKSFQLCKKDGEVCLRMVAIKEKLAGISDTAFLAISNMVSEEVFKGNPVNIELTNNKFETFKSFPYKKLDLESLPNPQ